MNINKTYILLTVCVTCLLFSIYCVRIIGAFDGWGVVLKNGTITLMQDNSIKYGGLDLNMMAPDEINFIPSYTRYSGRAGSTIFIVVPLLPILLLVDGITVYLLAQWWNRRVYRKQNRCMKCGYPLANSNTCPECG